MAPNESLKAPFPYPGGKSKVADDVWMRLGNVDNFIEPFMGSMAVLLRRPADHFANGYRVETANDLNHFIVNFWRAVKADPEAVAEYADSPVTECDLHARHRWLMRSEVAQEWRQRMATDPDCFDPKIAGWWVWGACCWIGTGWCNDGGSTPAQIVDLCGGFGSGSGVVKRRGGSTDWEQPPRSDAVGVLSTDGITAGRPQLTDAFDIGRGVNGGAASTQVPLLSGTGDGVYSVAGWEGTVSARRAWLVNWMRRLADRLRLVRTCYGHWSRICDSDSTLTRLGTTGVFLDPPYPAKSVNGKKSRDPSVYTTDKGSDLDVLRDEVLTWCRKWGQNSKIRIAVCGYEGDGYEALLADGWTETEWESQGGYGNQRKKGQGKAANAKRERIWYSPACLVPTLDLFSNLDTE